MTDMNYKGYNYSTNRDLESGLSQSTYINPFFDKSIRQGFIKKVYSLLTLQLLFTTALSALFIYNTSLNSFAKSDSGQGLLWVAIVGMFGCVIGPMCCCQDAYKKYPGNYVLLSIFTICTSSLKEG